MSVQNHEIPDWVYPAVETAARRVSHRWPNLDWEDIRQELWVTLLSPRSQLLGVMNSDNPPGMLTMKAGQVASGLDHARESHSGVYAYDSHTVRKLLESGILDDDTQGTVTEQYDFELAFAELAKTSPQFAHTLIQRYRHGEPYSTTTARKQLSRAVESLVKKMNWNHAKGIYEQSDRLNYLAPEDEPWVEYYDNDEIMESVNDGY